MIGTAATVYGLWTIHIGRIADVHADADAGGRRDLLLLTLFSILLTVAVTPLLVVEDDRVVRETTLVIK